MMVALRGTDIIGVPIAGTARQLTLVPPGRCAEAGVFVANPRRAAVSH